MGVVKTINSFKIMGEVEKCYTSELKKWLKSEVKTMGGVNKKVGSSFEKEEPTYSFWILTIYNTNRRPTWNFRP